MKWLSENWKTLIAVIYMIICIIDFAVIPSYILHYNYKISSFEYFREISEIFKDNQDAVNIILSDRNPGDWTPFSLRSGGIFHISFGAILTGTVLNGRKKKE